MSRRRDYPGRRYPPTPYPPRTKATSEYRDGWDAGWYDLGHRGWQLTMECEADLTDGPYRHGYRDGVMARWRYEEACEAGDRAARREAAERARREVPPETPY